EKPLEYRLHEPFKTVLLHAPAPAQLLEDCQAILQQLQSDEAAAAFSGLIQNSKTTVPPRPHARLGFVAGSLEECMELLQLAIQSLQKDQNAWNHPKGIYYRPDGIDP